jgi:hypothetical protein
LDIKVLKRFLTEEGCPRFFKGCGDPGAHVGVKRIRDLGCLLHQTNHQPTQYKCLCHLPSDIAATDNYDALELFSIKDFI